MNRALIRNTAYLQLTLAILMASGCAPTQPFFAGESPDLQYYLNAATRIEYPDVDVESLAETTMSGEPLSIGNHEYQFWDLTVEECTSIALQNAKFFVTTSGNAEFRQNVAAQFTSASADQLGSIYDVAIQQSTTQSIPLTVDGNGNRTLPRGVLRANQVGGVEDALAEFDAQASGFVNYSNTDRPRNTGAANNINPQFFTSTDVTQQSAISKRFATGGVGTLRQQIVYARNNAEISPISRVTPSDYTAVIEAQIQHPLMRNRGTLINRIPVVLASLNEDVSIADFEIQIRNLVRDVEVAYWDLYIAYRNVSTTIIGRNSAQTTAYYARLQFENGTGTRQEVAQAEGQYYAFRARLQGALSGSNLPGDDIGVYEAERILREKLGLAATDGRLIRPIQEPMLARVNFDWDEIVTEMLYLSPELRRGRTIIKQRELEEMSAKNQLLPEVNLSLLYRFVGVGDELGLFGNSDNPAAPAPGSSAAAELAGGDYQEAAIRLDITPPAIGGRRERARIRGSQLRLHQSRAFLQDAERLMVSQLSEAIAKTATHYQLAQTIAQQWQEAEVEVEARLAEFRGGVSDINVVLQSQQRKADAQIQYYRALSEYNKSLNYVDYLKGTMLANSNITLAEGPWNKKAYWDALERARERSAGKKKVYGVSRPSVVRQGPVRDAAGAAQVFGNRDQFHGDLPPGAVLQPESFDPMGANLQPYTQPSEAPSDIPLGEMGSSPSELLGPQTGPMEMAPGRDAPLPTPDALPESMGDVMPLSYDDAGPSAGQVIGSGYAGDVIIDAGGDGSPMPVRRKPIPSPRRSK